MIDLPETNRIIFLDIDGVVCTQRMAMSQAIPGGVLRALDPVAIGFLNQLHLHTGAHLVVTSYWRREVNVPIAMEAAGLQVPFHAAWATPSIPEIETVNSRPAEIMHWLMRNAPLLSDADYIILDDDAFAWHPKQRARVIDVNTYNGLSFEDMLKAYELFGLDYPPPRGRRHGFTPQPLSWNPSLLTTPEAS